MNRERFDYQFRLEYAIETVKEFIRRADNLGYVGEDDAIDRVISAVYVAAETAEEELKKIKEAANEIGI